MNPIKFPEANKKLMKPEGMGGNRCSSLWVYSDGCECISCWKMSLKQRLSALLFGRVWLFVASGYTQPPVRVDCRKSAFLDAQWEVQSDV